MGMLDEAIREHFDLKRRHGADPDEVAREEGAALASFVDDANERAEQAQESRHEADGQSTHLEYGRRREHDGHTDVGAQAKSDVALDNKETAEIDMDAVFGDLDVAEQIEHAPESGAERVAELERRPTAKPARARIDSPLSASIKDGSLAWEEPEPRVRRLSRRPVHSRVFDGESPAERSLP